MFVIVHESIFLKATLRSLSNNSNISFILGLATFDWIFHPVWDFFLVFGMIRNICLEPWHFHIMFWDPGSYSRLLFWSVFSDTALIKGEGWLLHYCQAEAAGQIPHSASADTIGVAPLLLGKSWLSTQPLRHHCSEEWREASLLPGGDEGPASPRGPSNTAGGPWLVHYRCRDASLSFRLVLHNSPWRGC